MIMDLLTLRNAAFASVQFCDGDGGEKKGAVSEFTGFVCVCVGFPAHRLLCVLSQF